MYYPLIADVKLIFNSQLIAINIDLIDCRWEINLYDVTVDIEEAGSSPVSAMTWVFSNLLAFRVSEKYCGQVIITGQISQSLGFKKSSTVIAMNFQPQHEPFVSWHQGWNNSTIRSSWSQNGSSNTLLKQLWHDSGFLSQTGAIWRWEQPRQITILILRRGALSRATLQWLEIPGPLWQWCPNEQRRAVRQWS